MTPHRFYQFFSLEKYILFSGILKASTVIMSDLMMRNQILGLRRAGMSCEEISVALEIDVMVVRLALEATGGSAVLRKEALKEEDITDDVSEAEAKEMMGIIKNIARDEESGVYARLNAAKYAHGAKRGYHKRHLDLNVGSGELLLKINEAYASAAMRARAALGGQSLTAKEITIEAPITVEAPVAAEFPSDHTTQSQPAAPKPRPFKI
jgi:hypothetical protein